MCWTTRDWENGTGLTEVHVASEVDSPEGGEERKKQQRREKSGTACKTER